MSVTDEATGEVTIPTLVFSRRLGIARDHAGFTQSQLAAQLGCSLRTVVNYEMGATSPSPARVVKWAELCGVDLAWLRGTRCACGSPIEPPAPPVEDD